MKTPVYSGEQMEAAIALTIKNGPVAASRQTGISRVTLSKWVKDREAFNEKLWESFK